MAENQQTQSALRKLLNETKVSSFASPKGGVVIVQSTESPYEGFQKLIKNNILSAPVYDAHAKKFTGFLDMKDLVSFVVFIDDDQKSDVPNDLKELVMHGTKMFKVPVDGVTSTFVSDLSRRNAFVTVTPSDSLWKVCEILAKGVHRVPVIDEKGDLVNIISQSSIIAFLQKHSPEFKTEFSFSITELGIGTKPVLSVNHNTPAIDTFRLMDNKKISGVAVVDDVGKLVGNTSASDLKLFMNTLSLDLLKLPINNFLKIIRQENVMSDKIPTISCNSGDSLSMLIAKLHATKVHRMFIADDAHGYKPSCVCSLTDVLRYLTKKY